MSEFLELLPPPDALKLFINRLQPTVSTELVLSQNALDRVTSQAVLATFALPSFPRSTVDGFAVRAPDTHGASESLPAYLNVVGEVPMGGTADFSLDVGECAIIHTGGMIPNGATGVVMVEYTQEAREGEVEILRAVGDGENILQVGEDVRPDDVVIPAGVKLRSAEIGGLMAQGLTDVSVAKRPKVGILSSGDEVVTPGEPLQMGQVYDVNSYSLRALVEASGGEPINYGVLPDNAESFRTAAQKAKAECDIVVFTAGSSVSVRDLTAQTIDELGVPGVLVHGISVRPGKPTILAVCDGTAVIGLPGNPVSALVIARIFVTATIEAMLGLAKSRPKAAVAARLTLNLSSQAGREDWIGVRLTETDTGYDAEPVFGKSNLIFTLAKADGLLRIPAAANGLPAGELVTVELL